MSTVHSPLSLFLSLCLSGIFCLVFLPSNVTRFYSRPIQECFFHVLVIALLSTLSPFFKLKNFY